VAAPRVLLTGGGTGGHLYPALNIAEALERVEPTVECFFLGSKRGIERRILPDTGYNFRLLDAQPLFRSRPWRNWRFLASAPRVWRGLRRTYREFEPDLVVGTGGYVAAPALAWAHRTGRRIALQEQNAQPGLATRMFASKADQIHLGYPEAETLLRVRSGTTVHAFGNPVSPPRTSDDSAPGAADFDWPDGRVLLVVGGSQGARGLNRCLLGDLELAAASASPEARAWVPGVSVVWVAGRDHADEVQARVERLPWADRFRVVPFIQNLGRQLDRVTLALSRSGAMLVAELCAAGRPALFVPLPTAAAGHQAANAIALHAVGAAEVREEGDLGPGELWALCGELLSDPDRIDRMATAAKARGRPDAAVRIAEQLLVLLDGTAA